MNGTSQSYAAPQFNGNINGMLWRSTGDDYLRKYDFSYDAANRLLSADFNQLNSNSFSKAAGINFSLSGMSYDENGNILSMNQKGWKLGGSVTIDSLIYNYFSNSNKLKKVTDVMSDPDTKLGDFHDGSNSNDYDYSYDGNGNLDNDWNKNLIGLELSSGGQKGIFYNHLNLVEKAQLLGKGEILYVYDANGLKLKKIINEGSVSKNILYMVLLFLRMTNFSLYPLKKDVPGLMLIAVLLCMIIC